MRPMRLSAALRDHCHAEHTFFDRYTWKSHSIHAIPAIHPNTDGSRILDAVSSALDLNFVPSSMNTEPRREKCPVTNLDQPAIENATIEVGIEMLTDLDVAAIVDLFKLSAHQAPLVLENGP